MKISLIGMSGSGKSYWAKMFETKSFKRFCADDLIEEKLGDELKRLGFNGISDVAKWMGQPFDSQYSQTSKRYLELEQEVMEEVLDYVTNANINDNIVVDTTGSVIYLDKNILKKLSQLTNIIYLDTPESVKQEMYDLYLREPKPVIWGESFQKKDSEMNIDALKRSYPELLAYRTKQYKKLADITMKYYILRNKNFTYDMFIERIKNDSV